MNGIAPPKPWFVETEPRVKLKQNRHAVMERDRMRLRKLGYEYAGMAQNHTAPEPWEWIAGGQFYQRYHSNYCQIPDREW